MNVILGEFLCEMKNDIFTWEHFDLETGVLCWNLYWKCARLLVSCPIVGLLFAVFLDGLVSSIFVDYVVFFGVAVVVDDAH